jgi:long-subunit acyl-CoA synthetase (AMP-forming)
VLLDLAALRIRAVIAGFEPDKFDDVGALTGRYGLRLLFSDRGVDGTGVRSIAEVRATADGPDPEVPVPSVSYLPEDVVTLKFTSGSTGAPKGLAATVASIDSSLRGVQSLFHHGPRDNLFVFLPLSLLQQRYWIYSALHFGHDVTVSRYEAAFLGLRSSRPTVVMGVPAFFQAAQAHIERQIARTGADPAVAARGLFGDRIRYLWTGSAPAEPAMLRFFAEHGLPIYEGYGLNETCIVTKNHPGAWKEGSVGQVLPGKRVELDAEGVITVHSDHPVNVRYEYCAPGDSERMFGPGGSVRTGDLGRLDVDGFLFVLGRADDVIVLGNGKKIIVRPLEEHLKQHPAIGECVVFCPNETHLVAVVSPTAEPVDEAAIAAHVAQANRLFGHDEQIRKVVIANRFSIDNGMLTSQYKPKRRRILDAYRQQINDSLEGIHAY